MFVPSVMIPSVPSAPMKILVMSIPADDFRARRRVLMTLPLGSTTVYEQVLVVEWSAVVEVTYNVEKPFSPRGTVPNGIS